MCGIAGKLRFQPGPPISRSEIEQMLRPMKYRGPDGQGIYLDKSVGLGHLRLSIIDVAGGAQPMTNEDETVWIVFNGEIYNYQMLRKDLVARGHTFRTRSDTEVIVHLYEEYGLKCLDRLRGMFAFALWDQRRQRLFVARDRMGIKPVYYSQESKTIRFASELKAILADPEFPREPYLPALRQFFSFFYVPGEETPFKSIRKLLPGHYLLAENGTVSIKRYWDLEFNAARANHSFEDVTEELHGLIESTVRDHMMSDVPVGVLVSGGVDSSAVLNFAVQGTAKKVKAFTIGFDSNQEVVDERPYARMAAKRFDVEHHELSISGDDFWDFLPSYVWHMEEPVCEPPAVALYYISRMAREHVKVLLSGEGGDEGFAGYDSYPDMLRFNGVGRTFGPLARTVGGAAMTAGRLFGVRNWARYAPAIMGLPLSEHYFSRNSQPTTFFNRSSDRFFGPDFLNAAPFIAPEFMAELLRPVSGATILDQMLYADSKIWLSDDLLIKADKMTMANSVELRVPLVDHVVLEFAASLGEEHKVKGAETKRALKAAFAKVLPREVIQRQKAGFPVPYNSWMRGELKGRIEDVLLSSQSAVQEYVRKDQLRLLLEANAHDGQYGREVFALLTLELWHKAFFNGSQ